MPRHNEATDAPASFEEQADTLLKAILSCPDGEKLFATAIILYKLREATCKLPPQEKLLLARRTLICCQNSAVPLLIAERADAVACLLENGIQSNRSPEFPEATPDQIKQLLLTCDMDIFTDIIDSVAVDNQHFYAPDNEYFGMDTVRKQTLDAIQNAVDKSVVASMLQDSTAPKKETPLAFKEMSEDIENALENILRDGFYPTFQDVCAELPFRDDFYPGYTLVVWGEENDVNEKFYSVSICESFDGESGESIVALFTKSDSFDDLQLAVETVLTRFDEKMTNNLFVFDDELLINDDFESVNAYLWALDGLVDRLPSSEEMENINFYVRYNVKTGSVNVVATYDTVVADGELNKEIDVPLSRKEKSQLITALQRFCTERYSESCFEFVNNARKSAGVEMIPNTLEKSALSDIIRAASLKVEDVSSSGFINTKTHRKDR